jgi:uncharacterized protein (DUF1778 family)
MQTYVATFGRVAETRTRRKPKAQRKEDSIRIRVTDAQKKTLTDAATRAGTGLSAWALIILLREAKKTEGE